MTEAYALIPAAGHGARFSGSSDAPNKIFADLDGRCVLWHAVAAFAYHRSITGIVVVAAPDELEVVGRLLQDLPNVKAIVAGRITRQESVAAGLDAIDAGPDAVVLIHDAARPLVRADVIQRCINSAVEHGSGVAALPVFDTIKSIEQGEQAATTVDRSRLRAVQTPQAFRLETIRAAYSRAKQLGQTATDDSTLLEGHAPVQLVDGHPDAFKITVPADLVRAQATLLERGLTRSESRVGFGYDIHQFAEGRTLMLGGVAIPTTDGRGLLGHSDADVLLHAVCDALLGAAGLPDIGVFFPNTEQMWKDIPSTVLLTRVARTVADQGCRVLNVDCTIIAEAPKIAPYTTRMKQVIADVLGLQVSSVGIKATTNEHLGSLGRAEGIAAFAVAALSKDVGGANAA